MNKSEYIIEAADLCKSYGRKMVLNHLSFKIKRGEFVTILGPSGCGKSTLLRIIGGFEKITSGSMLIDGVDIKDIPARRRPINTVFQSYALFPHMNVYENVAFGLKMKGIKESEHAGLIANALNMVGLDGYSQQPVTAMSGGQQQRVALARAIVNQPQILLLDESLSALDQKLRREMQMQLRKIHDQLGITFIFVTHDQEESMIVSDTVIVLNGGSIQQIGSPRDIYDNPANIFMSRFIGDNNILDVKINDQIEVTLAGEKIKCDTNGLSASDKAVLVISPEDVKMLPVDSDEAQWKGFIKSAEFRGYYTMYIVETESGLRFMVKSQTDYFSGSRVGIMLDEKSIRILPKL